MNKASRFLSICALSLFSAAVNAQSPPPGGLIAHWMLGGNGADSSGNAIHGIVHGATPDTGRNGLPGSAMRFDGLSYIDIPYQPLLNTQKFSIAAVVKMDVFNMGKCNLNSIFWRGYEFSQGGYGMIVFDNAFDGDCNHVDTTKNVFAGVISTNNDPNTHVGWQYAQTFRSRQWYSSVITYDGDTAKVYVNGVHMATNVLGDPVGVDTSGGFIGMRYQSNGYYPYPWNGVIDDIQIYNRVLSDSEIVAYQSYDTGVVTTSPPPSLGDGKLHESPSFKVFPNPATNVMTIAISGAGTQTDVMVVNTLGQLMYRQTVNQSGVQIATGSWPRGHYLVRVSSGDAALTKQIVLQ